MNITERLNQINNITIDNATINGFFLIPLEVSNCYYGKDNKGNIVFVICPEILKHKRKYKLTTSDLSLEVNVDSNFFINNECIKLTAHILTCLSKDQMNQIAFIRLCEAFKDSELFNDNDIIKLFNAFVDLFGKKSQSTYIELQGLFAELYAMRFFEKRGIDLYQYWQSEDKRKHDFCLNSKKRIEIKSTSKDLRIHHFLHEQLLTEFHDVKVISIITKKVDCGLSLNNLVSQIRNSPLSNYNLLLHIEHKLKNCSVKEQELLQFDEPILDGQLKIFDAKKIPHFNDKQPNGVFNAEYDSDLTGVNALELVDFKNWVMETTNNN